MTVSKKPKTGKQAEFRSLPGLRKKLLLLMMTAMLAVQLGGCVRKQTEEAAGTAEQESIAGEQENAAEEQESAVTEQEMAKAQADADEIDALHQENGSQTAAERADFGFAVPTAEGMEGWLCIESGTGEDGISREIYQCDEELKYMWECQAADTGSAADAGSAAETAVTEKLSGKGWVISRTSRNDQLSDRLQTEVYDYQAYEDDNGYSMYHQGIYVDGAEYRYLVDYSVMEGFFGDYYERITQLLEGVTIA